MKLRLQPELLCCLIGFGLLACDVSQDEAANTSPEARNEAQIAELEYLIKKQLEYRNENGSVESIRGFEQTEKLDEETTLANNEGFQELIQSEEEIFEFMPPDGVEAEFSEPVMISGAALFLANETDGLESKCGGLAYQPDEPTMKEIIEHAQKINTCGDVTVSFCIRLKMVEEIIAGQPNYSYTETPDLNFTLPCPEQSFQDLSIEIASGKSHTSAQSEKIKINALRSVISVYLTDTPGCLEGGEWQHITRAGPEWTLNFQDNTATVYAKFKDVYDAESDCVSDSIGYGLTTDQCFAEDPQYLSENILYGVSIGNIEGTAHLNYPVCTSDGETGCIANSDYQAENATGLAAKVLSGQTVGGVAGSAAGETRSNCTAAGQEGCITTDTYKSMDLSAKDAGGALDLSSSLFSARIKSSATFEFWDETGARYTAAGDADILEENIVDSTEVFGVTGNAGAAPDCSSISVGGTWILVPGDSNYRTNDFCVMKYEAKCSLADGSMCTASASSESPTSTVASTPWVSIDQQDAKTECASLGKGYHLITNDEWMTIATNVAAQGVNWDGGTVGTNEMARGHSDNNPTSACEADASDANAYVETNCATRSSSGTFNQRRTHTLSNGEVIWDLAGNVWEWTSYFNDTQKPTTTGGLHEYISLTGNSTMPITDLVSQAVIDNSWDSTESIGTLRQDNPGGGWMRGGRVDHFADSGVFTSWSYGPTSTHNLIGFRCAVAVP